MEKFEIVKDSTQLPCWTPYELCLKQLSSQLVSPCVFSKIDCSHHKIPGFLPPHYRTTGEDTGVTYPSVEDSQEVCTTSFSTSPPSQVGQRVLGNAVVLSYVCGPYGMVPELCVCVCVCVCITHTYIHIYKMCFVLFMLFGVKLQFLLVVVWWWWFWGVLLSSEEEPSYLAGNIAVTNLNPQDYI